MFFTVFFVATVALTGFTQGSALEKRIVESKSIDTKFVPRSRYDPIDYPGCGQRPVLSDNGASEASPIARIVGGSESVPHSWPAICSLRTSRSPNFHICGGNLVRNLDGKFLFITAAHCIDARASGSNYVARCGIHDRSDSWGGFVMNFQRIVRHESYNDYTLDNDIAILEPRTQPPVSDQIQAVCITNEGWNDMETAIAAGWGTTSSGGSSPYTLHQVKKPIKPRSVCEDRYGWNSITAQMLCAGFPDGGADSCQGDSGGPLYTYRHDRWTLTGITSWGIGCGLAGYPGVYADVDALKPWIDRVINSDLA